MPPHPSCMKHPDFYIKIFIFVVFKFINEETLTQFAILGIEKEAIYHSYHLYYYAYLLFRLFKLNRNKKLIRYSLFGDCTNGTAVVSF